MNVVLNFRFRYSEGLQRREASRIKYDNDGYLLLFTAHAQNPYERLRVTDLQNLSITTEPAAKGSASGGEKTQSSTGNGAG